MTTTSDPDMPSGHLDSSNASLHDSDATICDYEATNQDDNDGFTYVRRRRPKRRCGSKGGNTTLTGNTHQPSEVTQHNLTVVLKPLDPNTFDEAQSRPASGTT